ncbi:MAG: hypothetical protein MJ250_05350 [Alphaproteobacteria bacterium]|nr:hypothetical protein [Alphaproteobacteria bacterium]
MTENSKIKKIEEKYGDENHDSILADLLTDEELAVISAGKRIVMSENIADSVFFGGDTNIIPTSVCGVSGDDYISTGGLLRIKVIQKNNYD